MSRSDVTRTTLAAIVLLAFNLSLAALFRFEVPETNRDMVIYMLGQLSGMATTALAFYFGTSRSSQEKNEVISDIAARPAPQNAVAAARDVADAAEVRADQIEGDNR